MNEAFGLSDASAETLYNVPTGGHVMRKAVPSYEDELKIAYEQVLQEFGDKVGKFCTEEELWEYAKERVMLWEEVRLADAIYEKEGRPVGTSFRLWRLKREAQKEPLKDQ